jgi:hypothetical protein
MSVTYHFVFKTLKWYDNSIHSDVFYYTVEMVDNFILTILTKMK